MTNQEETLSHVGPLKWPLAHGLLHDSEQQLAGTGRCSRDSVRDMPGPCHLFLSGSKAGKPQAQEPESHNSRAKEVLEMHLSPSR